MMLALLTAVAFGIGLLVGAVAFWQVPTSLQRRYVDALQRIAANGRNGHACSSGQCTITYPDKRVETYVCPICTAGYALRPADA